MTSIIISAFLLGILIFLQRSRRIAGNITAPKVGIYNKSEAEKFTKSLEQLDYFKYADPQDVDDLRNSMIQYYNPEFGLTTTYKEGTTAPLDYRCYFCDGEYLFQPGGLTQILTEIKPTFDKIGLLIRIDEDCENWDTEKRFSHSITINGTKHIVFKNFSGEGWGESAQRLAEILNYELEKQGKEERVYLINFGYDGELVFLTEPQLNYIKTVIINRNWQPLNVKNWCQQFGLKPLELD